MLHYRKVSKKVAQIRISGPDKKGIIATMTGYLYKNNCNIEDIDQRILHGYLIMNMLVDYTDVKKTISAFVFGLKRASGYVGTEVEFKPVVKKAKKNVAILVSKESHCLVDLLKCLDKKNFKGEPDVIIGNHPHLREVAKKYKVPFYFISSAHKRNHEARIISILKKYEIDLIVLARYMQILSPEFVFRYEGKIINIHPSLLPAFPGPRSYHQAYNKGVEVVGVTAHFVTTDLDEGPIIAQDCFRVDRTSDTMETFFKKGKQLEAKVLTRAVKLFLDDRLSLRRGKVIDSRSMHQFFETTQRFYSS